MSAGTNVSIKVLLVVQINIGCHVTGAPAGPPPRERPPKLFKLERGLHKQTISRQKKLSALKIYRPALVCVVNEELNVRRSVAVWATPILVPLQTIHLPSLSCGGWQSLTMTNVVLHNGCVTFISNIATRLYFVPLKLVVISTKGLRQMMTILFAPI